MNDERKPLTVTGVNVGPDVVKSILHEAGFEAVEEIGDAARPPASDTTQIPIAPWYKTYFPILLILAYLAGFVALLQVRAGEWQWVSTMRNFMGGFFIVFSFFKLLNLSGFADAYATYDVAAMRCAPTLIFIPLSSLPLVPHISQALAVWRQISSR